MSNVPSRIDTVRLYRRGATVRRRVELGATRPGEVEISALPLALWDATARVRVVALEGPPGSDVVASSVRIGLWAPPRETPPEPPEVAEIRALEGVIARDEAAQQALRTELSLLSSITIPERPPAEVGRPPPRSPLAARLALEELVDDGVRTRTQAIEALEQTLRTARESLADARARRDRASNAKLVSPTELKKTVIIGLTWSGPAATSVTLELEYFVPGARWAPAYQCRMSRDGRETSLSLRALVCQRSGEDWSAAKLELSTAAPVRWTELPELSALRIGKAQASAPTKRGFRPPPQGASALLDDYDRDLAKLPRPQVDYHRPQLALAPPGPSEVTESRKGGGGAYSGTPLTGYGGMSPAMDVMERESAAESWDEDGGTREHASLGGMATMVAPAMAPPPPPSAKAAPAPMAAGPSRARMAARSEAPKSMKKERARARDRAQDLDDEEVMAEPEEGGESPLLPDDFLFTQLRLRGPAEGSERGKLVPSDPFDRYLEILGRSGLVVAGDARSALAHATQRAESAAQVPLPRGAMPLRDDRTSFDYAYRADAPVDVPSDGAFHSVPVTSTPLESDVAYVVVPREDPNVFRVATLTNKGSTPFLAGPVEVYVADEYVLTADLPSVPGGGRFQLGLGVEQAIKCARNTRYAETRSGDKVVATHELVHTIEIELANNLDREIRCEVRERIPQPARGAEVVVEEGAVSPPWAVYNQAERGQLLAGGRKWVVTVAAGGRSKLSAEYVVKIYANNEITGGNRREA